MSAGSNSSRSTPLLGLAFLISAMTAARPAAIFARKAPSKSRVSTRLKASSRMASSDFFFFAAATSSRLTATIWFRMSDMGSGRQLLAGAHQLFELALGGAGVQRGARLGDAFGDVARDIGRVERDARIED